MGLDGYHRHRRCWGAERSSWGDEEVAWGQAERRPVWDTREDAFNPSLEMWVWTPLEAGTGDTDLDSSHGR